MVLKLPCLVKLWLAPLLRGSHLAMSTFCNNIRLIFAKILLMKCISFRLLLYQSLKQSFIRIELNIGMTNDKYFSFFVNNWPPDNNSCFLPRECLLFFAVQVNSPSSKSSACEWHEYRHVEIRKIVVRNWVFVAISGELIDNRHWNSFSLKTLHRSH